MLGLCLTTQLTPLFLLNVLFHLFNYRVKQQQAQHAPMVYSTIALGECRPIPYTNLVGNYRLGLARLSCAVSRDRGHLATAHLLPGLPFCFVRAFNVSSSCMLKHTHTSLKPLSHNFSGAFISWQHTPTCGQRRYGFSSAEVF